MINKKLNSSLVVYDYVDFIDYERSYLDLDTVTTLKLNTLGYKFKVSYFNGYKYKFIPSVEYFLFTLDYEPLKNCSNSFIRDKSLLKDCSDLSKNDIIIDNKGELLEVLAYNGSVLRVFNGINAYDIHINDVREVLNE